ncbi:MFS polyamine transporter [Wolfiporia cocos MD-104 SS10]|uniref:MFS polyamine transporter n=1 Tax=Wolfiporia cocos (strain MD-104) TaxID=742152 RepID=A0A2H3IX22_WOLCO|nr:MFS polyamine transporter [Wolfiporia cocos MD-104 SS10]
MASTARQSSSDVSTLHEQVPFTSPPDPDSPLQANNPQNEDSVASPQTLSGQKVPSTSEPDILIVNWDGPDDPENPRNWSTKKKWAAAATVSAFTFISPISSSMVAPAAAQVAERFGITSSVEAAMTISVFVLAYAVGPLFLGPLSEIFGRVHILRGGNLWFAAWNLGCGFAQSKSQLIAFRFLAGLGGSAPLATGGAVLSDMWTPEQRGQAIAIYSLAPLLGPVIGPVAGGWIAERSTWRWVFWSTTIAAIVIQIFGLFMLQETYAPILLQQRAKRIRKQMDAEKGENRQVRTAYQNGDVSLAEFIRKALVRPFVLFAQEPIIQLIGLYLAFIYGVIYLVLTTIPGIFTYVYHENVGIGGLNYIGLGLGLFITSQINARLLDRVYIHFKNRNGGVGRPEFRLPTVFPGTLLLPIGLLMSGWAAEKHVHWIVVDIGLAFIGSGMILTFQGMQTYVIDAFTMYAASALAAVSCFRSLAGFGFPLFAPAMYDALGYGKGNTILAACAFAIGPPAVFAFWTYGERLRGMSRHAHKIPAGAQPAQKA